MHLFILPDLNIPICGFAAVLVFAFLKLRVPPGTFWEKTKRIDWLCVSISLFHICVRPLTDVCYIGEICSLLPVLHRASSA
jgi:hypothetical protein